MSAEPHHALVLGIGTGPDALGGQGVLSEQHRERGFRLLAIGHVERRATDRLTDLVRQQIIETEALGGLEYLRAGNPLPLGVSEFLHREDPVLFPQDLSEPHDAGRNREVPVEIEPDGADLRVHQRPESLGETTVAQRPMPLGANILLRDLHQHHVGIPGLLKPAQVPVVEEKIGPLEPSLCLKAQGGGRHRQRGEHREAQATVVGHGLLSRPGYEARNRQSLPRQPRVVSPSARVLSRGRPT